MKGKRSTIVMRRLAAVIMAPALGAAAGVQADERAAAAVGQEVTLAQADLGSMMGPFGPPGAGGPPEAPPFAMGPGPGGGPQGGGGPGAGGPPFGYGPPGPPGAMGGMMGPGMMQGQGGPGQAMGAGDQYGMARVMQVWQLPDLNEEQRNKLKNVAQDLRKKHWDLKGAMMDASDKLSQLWSADPVDANAIGEAYGNLFDLQRQWIVSDIETRQQVDNILTAEQKRWLQGGAPMAGGAFPMMHPRGGMMPGMPGMPGMRGGPGGGAPGQNGGAQGAAAGGPPSGAQQGSPAPGGEPQKGGASGSGTGGSQPTQK